MSLPYEKSIITEIKILGSVSNSKKVLNTTSVNISCYCSSKGTQETIAIGFENEDLHSIIIEGDYSNQIQHGNGLTITGNNAGDYIVKVSKPRINPVKISTQIVAKKV